MKYVTALMLFLGLFSGSLEAKTLTLNPSRTVEILGPIDENLLDQATKLHELGNTKQPIDILINSYGGSVFYGRVFTQAMGSVKGRGIRLRCVVGVAAASMAFQIFTHCDERYTLKNTQLLYHPPYFPKAENLNTTRLQELYVDIYQDEFQIFEELRATFGVMTPEQEMWLSVTFHSEKWWGAAELLSQSPRAWFEIVQDIRNCPNLFKMPKDSDAGKASSSLLIKR